jgi:hypothetical protein
MTMIKNVVATVRPHVTGPLPGPGSTEPPTRQDRRPALASTRGTSQAWRTARIGLYTVLGGVAGGDQEGAGAGRRAVGVLVRHVAEPPSRHLPGRGRDRRGTVGPRTQVVLSDELGAVSVVGSWGQADHRHGACPARARGRAHRRGGDLPAAGRAGHRSDLDARSPPDRLSDVSRTSRQPTDWEAIRYGRSPVRGVEVPRQRRSASCSPPARCRAGRPAANRCGRQGFASSSAS